MIFYFLLLHCQAGTCKYSTHFVTVYTMCITYIRLIQLKNLLRFGSVGEKCDYSHNHPKIRCFFVLQYHYTIFGYVQYYHYVILQTLI